MPWPAPAYDAATDEKLPPRTEEALGKATDLAKSDLLDLLARWHPEFAATLRGVLGGS